MRPQSRKSYLGMERQGLCHISGIKCIRSDGDCGSCTVVEGIQAAWACAFCLRRDPVEITLPGVYKAGECERCQQERILLMAVVG